MNHIFTIRIKAGIAGQSIDAYLKRAVKNDFPFSTALFVHLCLVIDNGSTASFSCADFDSGGQFGYEYFTVSHMTGVAGVADGLNQFSRGVS